MNRLQRWTLRGAAYFQVLSLLRRLLNLVQIKKSSTGQPAFPYIRRRRNRSIQILVYHRVNDENDCVFPGVPIEVFNEQMEYVAENYQVSTLDDLVQRLPTGDVPENALAITFDDGYRDNYEHAFPILKRLGLPATIFLATDGIDSGRMLWHDWVFAALRETRVTALENFRGNGSTYPLNTPAEKRHALMEVLKFLWSLDDRDRSLWVERLINNLGIEEPVTCEGLMLGWDDIRIMSEHRVTFGAHTVTHPILSKLPTRQLKREIRESKATIESKLNMPVKHFAYPVGRREDFTDDVKNELRDAGFECAVTTIFGANDSKQDLFELRRATPWEHDIDAFALRLNYFKFISS
jgi:peptidoglycan/xylan/chitin deacetylase (PgdA/CDA1 family)